MGERKGDNQEGGGKNTNWATEANGKQAFNKTKGKRGAKGTAHTQGHVEKGSRGKKNKTKATMSKTRRKGFQEKKQKQGSAHEARGRCPWLPTPSDPAPKTWWVRKRMGTGPPKDRLAQHREGEGGRGSKGSNISGHQGWKLNIIEWFRGEGGRGKM